MTKALSGVKDVFDRMKPNRNQLKDLRDNDIFSSDSVKEPSSVFEAADMENSPDHTANGENVSFTESPFYSARRQDAPAGK